VLRSLDVIHLTGVKRSTNGMFETFKPIIPEGGHHKGTSVCQESGCSRTTREGKPFCSDHIESSPYVQEILGVLAERNIEARILEQGVGRIDKEGYFYKETLLLLRSKNYTARGLARRLDLTFKAARRLIILITSDGLARCKETSKGDLYISTLGEKDLAPPKNRN